MSCPQDMAPSTFFPTLEQSGDQIPDAFSIAFT